MKTVNSKKSLEEIATSDLFFSQLVEQYEIMYHLWVNSLGEKVEEQNVHCKER